MHTNRRVSDTRTDWFKRAVDQCQAFAMRATVLDRHDFLARVDQLLSTVENPQNGIERALLDGLFFKMAMFGARDFHSRYHHSVSCTCQFNAVDATVTVWKAAFSRDPKETFRSWAAAFIEELLRHHLVAPEYRARGIIDQTFRTS